MGKNVDDIIEEAREGFDLRARLLGVSPLKRDVTIYTDAVVGKELGGAEDQKGQGGIVLGRRRWGVLGRLDEIKARVAVLRKMAEQNPESVDVDEIDALEDEKADLEKQAAPLAKKLNKTALVFTVCAVPDIVVRKTRRETKEHLGIKGKGISGREEDFGLEFTARLLAASVEKWTDNSTGTEYDSLSIQQARDLRDHLPAGQFIRLDNALSEVSFEAQIGANGTDSADF